MAALRWTLLLVFAGAMTVALLLQRESAANLRDEMGLLRDDQRELVRLRAEHVRLLAAQPPAAELTRLQTDRAALQRLRTELEKMTEHAEAASRRLAQPMDAAAPATAQAALTLSVALAGDGAVSLEGNPVDWAGIKQRLSRLAHGATFDVRVSAPVGVHSNQLQTVADAFKAMAQELDLRMTFLLEPGQAVP